MNLKNYKNEKHNIPKPEDVFPNIYYTFSYNPIDQPDMLTHPGEWMKEHRKTFKSMLYSNFRMYPEFSRMGRWHYHGIVRIKDISMFYLQDLPKLIPYGSIEMDTIQDPWTWLRYCVKNRELVERVFDIDSIPYFITTE